MSFEYASGHGEVYFAVMLKVLEARAVSLGLNQIIQGLTSQEISLSQNSALNNKKVCFK